HTGGEIELHQCVNRLRRRIDDVEQPLVGPDFELLTRLLVDVRRAVHRKLLNSRRQRDRTSDLGARALRRADDLARGRIEDAMVKRLEPYANVLAVHLVIPEKNGTRRTRCAPRPGSQILFDDLRHHAGADGPTTLTNGEAKLFFHG